MQPRDPSAKADGDDDEYRTTLVVICGPTASGKTDLAVRLALERGGDVVNADMGQLYRGMDIGTAKPSIEERQGIPFHCLDQVDPPERFGAGAYVEVARRAMDGIRKRGKTPIVVGGTGLYIKALTEGLFEGPGSDHEVRAALELRIKEEGLARLHDELRRRDPKAALKIHPNDRLRIVRALEVFELTGKPISSWQREWAPHSPPPVRSEPLSVIEKIAVDWPRDELYRRIDARVIRMIDRGWIDETRMLVNRWGRDAYAIRICIGYREIVDSLGRGLGQDKLIEIIQRRTRQYAKRQLTWFRADHAIRWIDPHNLTRESS